MKKLTAALATGLLALTASTMNFANAADSKAFQLLSDTTLTSTRIPYYWQANEDLLSTLLYRGLVIPNSTFTEVKPDLAQSYTVSPDGLTYTFVMKPDLKWSDGTPLTAKDVEWSIKTALKVAIINGIFPKAFSDIVGGADYKAGKTDTLAGLTVDGDTVKIQLERPMSDFMDILAQFVIFPEHSLKDQDPLTLHNSPFWSKPVVDGMFQVKKVVGGNYIVYDQNPYYKGPRSEIKTIVTNTINNQVLALKDAKTYMITTNNPDDIKQAKTIPGVVSFPINMTYYRYFIVNLSGLDGKGHSQLANPLVREAILYAVDRKSLAESLYPGVATVDYTGVPVGFAGMITDAKKYEYNPAKARQLLHKAKFKQRKPLILTYYYSDQRSKDLMQAVSYYLSQVGIKNEVVQITSDPTTALFKTRKYDLAYKGLSSFGYGVWYGEYVSSNTNFARIFNNDKSFDNLLTSYSEARNQDDRQALLNKLQKLEQEKFLKLPLFNFRNVMLVNEDKVVLPKGMIFGNPNYRYDYNFQDWKLK